jgi:hypothetical protein
VTASREFAGHAVHAPAIVGAAFVPETPLLVPEVAQGAAHELAELRSACRSAITRVAARAERICIVAGGPASRCYPPSTRATLAGYGVNLEVPLGDDAPGPVAAPASLAVGAWLVRDALGPNSGATGWCVGPDGAVCVDLDRTALVVVGDGSARRTTSAPGYLDPRAAPFDAAVAAALRGADPARLRVDGASARQLLAGGARAWAAAAAVLDGASYDAELLYEAAPYGVGYFVAAWTARA